MRKRSVTLDDELESALEEYIADQPDEKSAAAVVRLSLREFLHRRGYAGPRQQPVVTPASVDEPTTPTSADRNRADEIHDAIDAYFDAQSAHPSTAAVVQAALREYLKVRGVLMPTEPFCPTPAEHGSGYRNTSREHDKALAESVD